MVMPEDRAMGSTSLTERTYSRFADADAKNALQKLLSSTKEPAQYQAAMKSLGCHLGKILNEILPNDAKCLIASTAEDADFLSLEILNSLRLKREALVAIFWNNHYSIANGSIAPIVHKYLQPNYEKSNHLIIVKSVISGSCVVRTNILALIEKLNVGKIYIASPVMHVLAEDALRSEFPESISSKFEFIYFAKDTKKDGSSGEVIPGIGGQIYKLLGIGDLPVKTGYMPKLVKELAQKNRQKTDSLKSF